jgi:hypothetical protein
MRIKEVKKKKIVYIPSENVQSLAPLQQLMIARKVERMVYEDAAIYNGLMEGREVELPGKLGKVHIEKQSPGEYWHEGLMKAFVEK